MRNKYEPIAGDITLFRAPEGNLIHLTVEEQVEKGMPSREGETNKKPWEE